MAKLKSEFTLSGSVLTFVCKDEESGNGFNVDLDLAGVFGIDASQPNLQLSAVVFAARTALRNATGGKEIDEAEEAVNARIEAWKKGEWGAEREAAEGAPFTQGNVLAKAVARVYSSRFPDASAAAAMLSSMLHDQLKAQPGSPVWADLSEEDQRKARNAFTRAARAKDGAVDAAIAAIQAEQAAARSAKKNGAAPAAGGLFT